MDLIWIQIQINFKIHMHLKKGELVQKKNTHLWHLGDNWKFAHTWTYIDIKELLWLLEGLDGKVSACNVGDPGSIPGLGRSPGEGNSNPLPYPCLEKSHGQCNLVGYSPWGCTELDTTEQLHFRIWNNILWLFFKESCLLEIQ